MGLPKNRACIGRMAVWVIKPFGKNLSALCCSLLILLTACANPEEAKEIAHARADSAIVSQQCVISRLWGNKPLPKTNYDNRYSLDPCVSKSRMEGLEILTTAEANRAWDCLIDDMQGRWEKSAHPIVGEYLGWKSYTSEISFAEAQGGCYMKITVNPDGERYGKYEKSGLLPYGTRIAKGTFAATLDGRLLLGTLLTMEKLIGAADTVNSEDWRFTHILADGTVYDSLSEVGLEKVSECITCHKTAKFGDLVFYPPKSTRR